MDSITNYGGLLIAHEARSREEAVYLAPTSILKASQYTQAYIDFDWPPILKVQNADETQGYSSFETKTTV